MTNTAVPPRVRASSPARSSTGSGRSALGGRRHLGVVAAAATLLATAPLAAIFDGWGWLFNCVLTVAAITGAAMVARALRGPLWAQTLAMLGALLMALTWLFRSGDELFGLLPTASTFRHFALLLEELPSDVRTHAIPVPALDSLQFVVAFGVGLVAILIDLCAVGLRRPGLAGLPMLAIYSVPVAVMFRAVPVFTFALGVAGYLWLLGTDNMDRVRRFGRRFTGDGRDVDMWEPSPLAAAGRRLALIGVAIAVVLPVLVPGVSTGLIDRIGAGFSGRGGTGGGDGAVNLFASLDGLLNRDETVDLLEVVTDDPEPHYLRIGVADQITAEGFDHRRPRGRSLTEGPPWPGNRPGVTLRRHQAEVSVTSNFAQARLPTYQELQEVNGLGEEWRYDVDQQVVFGGDTSSGVEYDFVYARPEYDPEALRSARALPVDDDLQRFAHIPEELQQDEVTELVADLTSDQGNAYDQVLAILGYFTTDNGFRYSLETGNETTGSAIVDFLIVNQQGYCVQYASAMTWMVRELGLPARVAIGFTSGGSRTEGSFTLTNHNAHAWPEVYFEGFGWVPFEPTPRSSVRGSVATEWAPDPNSPDSSEPDTAPQGPSGETPGPVGPNEDPPFPDDEGAFAGGPAPDQGGTRLLWWVLGGVAMLLGVLFAPAMTRLRLRRTRLGRARAATDPAGVMTVVAAEPQARAKAHAAWEELLDTMVDFRIPLDPAETPRLTVNRLIRSCRLDEEPDGGATLIGHAEERARYARTPLPADGLLPALRSVRRGVAATSTPWVRLRAALLPPSTLHRWRAAISDLTTGVASMLNRWGELIARLSPRRLLRSTSATASRP